MNLTLQINQEFTAAADIQLGNSVILITPPLNEDYWLFRVKVWGDQAIVGFPKFSTIGIGFAIETDWNTNLPWMVPADEILEHIRHNKGCSVPDARCLEAIRMIQKAAEKHQRLIHGDVYVDEQLERELS